MRSLVLIAHNLRSAHNIGSLLRTAEGLGVDKVYLTGYTPYPSSPDDNRLPHISHKVNRQIIKTSLNAEKTIDWQHVSNVSKPLNDLKRNGFSIVALEQSEQAVQLPIYFPPDKLALIVGREVGGIEKQILDRCDQIVEIPMIGQKESFNVVQAAAMALYTFRFCDSK
ncbi:MAG TPA: TrmH family RNA methyltransferase [Candidatus Saccharimonadales bacterium]|nr:TrmH family RNA methyltransferase [Candidatus Saccharimonadales bacterium]